MGCEKCRGTGWLIKIQPGQREFGGDASTTYKVACECNPQPCPNCKERITKLEEENQRLTTKAEKYKKGFWGRACGRLSNKNQKLTAELEMAKAENQSFGNVLAVIHRDGGHYITKHGYKKAAEDAITFVLKLRTKLELAKKKIDIVRKGKLKMPPLPKKVPLIDVNNPKDAYAYGWATAEFNYGEELSKPESEK